MLTDTELERLFAQWKTPAAGRALIRQIRTEGPVRNLQWRMDGVRTRLVSKKMGGKALYAESRTCEFPALYFREFDPETVELWPQPCTLDLKVAGPNGGVTRVQHTPDLFIIEHGFIIEEWREYPRLLRLAAQRPEHFYRDDKGLWHYLPVEQHLQALGIEYRLRCSDEHPRIYLSNLSFLEDYLLESTPLVPEEERQRLSDLLAQRNMLAHLSLVAEHGFSADHVFQLVADRTVYVDLNETALRKTGELVVYRDKTVARADAVLRREAPLPLPSSAIALSVGTRFLFDGKRYEVALLGTKNVTARDIEANTTSVLSIELVEQLFQQEMVMTDGTQPVNKEFDKDSLFHEKRLGEAIERMENLQNPEATHFSVRTIRRWRTRVQGIVAPQEQLAALVSRNPGNTTPRLPNAVVQKAKQAVREFHNTAKSPKVLATYNEFVVLCEEAGLTPMSRASFYEWIRNHEDVAAREGRRKAYQKAPIPLSYDYEHSVHGVQPHEVCYCDHTIVNLFLKGSVLPDLGKPTLTLMVDGALSMARAFYLSYRPASAVSVLMCLRDYVRRNRRLPRILVLDNGKEFHSGALLLFCSMFGITIRWRRRSRPRDSSIIERMLGATEQEVIAQLDGNSLALKDPRMVSSSHLPHKHIQWTLPGLHGAIEYFLFEVHAKRIHPRFGVSPLDYEKRLFLEYGARSHVLVRFDEALKLLTAPHSGKAARAIDRLRGVFVDGFYYWHDILAQARPGETAVVRVELWRARIVYVCFRNEWYVALARDGGTLEGRFRQEFELQQREEARVRKGKAQNDKVSPANSKKRSSLWKPEVWDARLREQLSEMYYLYERLGMTEVLPAAKNQLGGQVSLPMPKGSELEMLPAVEAEPGACTVENSAPALTEPAAASTDPAHPKGRARASTRKTPFKPSATTSPDAKHVPPPPKPVAAPAAESAPVATSDDDYF